MSYLTRSQVEDIISAMRPYAVLGVEREREAIVRLHFLEPTSVEVLEAAHDTLAPFLPAHFVLHVSCRVPKGPSAQVLQLRDELVTAQASAEACGTCGTRAVLARRCGFCGARG